MRRLKVLIVDDEPLARSGLKKLCSKDPDLEVTGECADGHTAVAAIGRLEPDLLLLDIQMPGMNGFEVLRALGPDSMPQVIFVTAYDQFAVRAFEVSALDYLLKPFSDERFREALAKAKKALEDADRSGLHERLRALLNETGTEAHSGPPGNTTVADAGMAKTSFLSRITVKTGGSVRLVRVDEIQWIEAVDYYARLHTADGEYLIRKSLRSLETQLSPAEFFRVSRSAIVKLDQIGEIQPYSRGSHIIILRNGTRVMLTRSRREALEHRLGQPL